MKLEAKTLDTAFDDTTANLRASELDDAAVAESADRVWQRLLTADLAAAADEPVAVAAPSGPITGCAGYQALIPAYLAGQLPAGRALLFENHTRECVPCRRALKSARTGSPAAATAAPRRVPIAWRWAAAAILILGVGLAGSSLLNLLPTKGESTVVAVDGSLFAVDSHGARGVGIGTVIPHGTTLRTSTEGRAVVRLPDGTLVEMGERAALSVGEKRRETTIALDRGAIIVQAAKQRNKHLYVATGDCMVAVTGTIFSVNHGTKGSRVSVIEGEVHVDQARRKDVLHPGDQVTTSVQLVSVPLSREISWSRDRDSYLRLVAELKGLEQEIRETVNGPERRTSTDLLDQAPASTAVWVALPNLSESLGEAYAIFERRLGESPMLSQWWQEHGGSEIGPHLQMTVAHLHDFGTQLGPEVAVAVLRGTANNDAHEALRAPVAMARITASPAAFATFLDAEIATINGEHPEHAAAVVRIADPLALPAADADTNGEQLMVWIHDDLFLASPSLWALQSTAHALDGSGPSFTTTTFYDRLSTAYGDGIEWLVAADLASLISTAGNDAELVKLGVADAEHLILESESANNRTATQAVFTFSHERRGVVSWLGAPAAMGALDYVTPDATLAAAFIAKEPAAMVDDILTLLAGHDGDALAKLEQFESEHGISLRDDIAGPLGGEVAVALDGPALPTPAWKVVVEVNDRARFDQTVSWAVGELDAALRRDGQGSAALATTTEGGVDFHTVTVTRTNGASTEVHYAHADGYAIFAPAAQLISQAFAAHDSGVNLASSERFTALLPTDGQANLSAVIYAYLAPLAGPLGSLAGGALTAEQQALFTEVGNNAVLGYAYAEADRVTLAATSAGGFFGLDWSSLLSLGGILENGAAAHHGARSAAPAARAKAAPAAAGRAS
jgi:hypothetical protein